MVIERRSPSKIRLKVAGNIILIAVRPEWQNSVTEANQKIHHLPAFEPGIRDGMYDRRQWNVINFLAKGLCRTPFANSLLQLFTSFRTAPPSTKGAHNTSEINHRFLQRSTR